MLVVRGSASRRLASELAQSLGCELLVPELKRFPDGETYLNLGRELEGEHVVVVQSTCYPQNDNLVELLLLLDAARDLGAKRVTAVVPYFGYARQDKRFKPGEAISALTMGKLIKSLGAQELLTVDIHEAEILHHFGFPTQNLSAMPLLGKHLATLGLKKPVALAPDEPALDRAREVAAELGGDFDFLEKRRITPKRVEVRPRSLGVRGRDVAIVDDIISTGGTVIKAARMLQRQGARKIYAACTHAVLVGDALRRIREAGVKKIIATNTIEHRLSVVSVAPLLASALRDRV